MKKLGKKRKEKKKRLNKRFKTSYLDFGSDLFSLFHARNILSLSRDIQYTVLSDNKEKNRVSRPLFTVGD